MARRSGKLSAAERVIALVLAIVWLGASLIAIVLGLRRGEWWTALVRICGFWYGALWLRAAREGRYLRLPEGAWPWRSR